MPDADSNVGAGLPAKAVCQLLEMLDVTDCSQASQLPQDLCQAQRITGAMGIRLTLTYCVSVSMDTTLQVIRALLPCKPSV
jgi:hypothetical protein